MFYNTISERMAELASHKLVDALSDVRTQLLTAPEAEFEGLAATAAQLEDEIAWH